MRSAPLLALTTQSSGALSCRPFPPSDLVRCAMGMGRSRGVRVVYGGFLRSTSAQTLACCSAQSTFTAYFCGLGVVWATVSHTQLAPSVATQCGSLDHLHGWPLNAAHSTTSMAGLSMRLTRPPPWLASQCGSLDHLHGWPLNAAHSTTSMAGHSMRLTRPPPWLASPLLSRLSSFALKQFSVALQLDTGSVLELLAVSLHLGEVKFADSDNDASTVSSPDVIALVARLAAIPVVEVSSHRVCGCVCVWGGGGGGARAGARRSGGARADSIFSYTRVFSWSNTHYCAMPSHAHT
jgi:hypothetical protein